MQNSLSKIITLFVGCIILTVSIDAYMRQPKAQVALSSKQAQIKKKMRMSLADPTPMEVLIAESKPFIDSLAGSDSEVKAEARRSPATFVLQVEILKRVSKAGLVVDRAASNQKTILCLLDSLLRRTPDTVYYAVHDTIHIHDTTRLVPKTPNYINFRIGKNKTMPYILDTIKPNQSQAN